MKALIEGNELIGFSHEVGIAIENINNLEIDARYAYDFEIVEDKLHLKGIKESISAIARNTDKYTDYKQARQAIKQLVNAQGFENLTAEEQLVACQWFAASEEQIKATIPNLEERLKAGSEFDAQSVASRSARLSAVKTLLYNVLSKEDGVKVIGSILQFNFETLYTKLGQEGTQSLNYKGDADNAGLYDFLQSTTQGREAFGYVLEDLGIAPLEGFSVEALVARCMEILDNGNY
jgi:hypothetical protein